jgi:hypothetical protein
VKIEYMLFVAGAVFFFPLALVYGWLTQWDEQVGVVGILLAGALAALIASYLWVTSRRIDERPEDDVYGEIAEGAGEQGFFPPHSWWPLAVGAAVAVVFLGLAVGVWVFLIGFVASMLALVGWVFEYYRGVHAH